jgi:hypothetical protein
VSRLLLCATADFESESKFKFGGNLIRNRRPATHFPKRTAPTDNLNLQTQLITWGHLMAKTPAIESREHRYSSSLPRESNCGIVRQDATRLDHGFAKEYSRHNRPARKMTVKERLVNGNILQRDNTAPSFKFYDSIDQEEWVAVGQNRCHLDGVFVHVVRRQIVVSGFSLLFRRDLWGRDF